VPPGKTEQGPQWRLMLGRDAEGQGVGIQPHNLKPCMPHHQPPLLPIPRNSHFCNASRLEKLEPEASWTGIHQPRNFTTLVNFLQMVHPDLSAERVMQLLYMQMQPDLVEAAMEEDAREEHAGGGGEEGGEEQGAEAAGAEAADAVQPTAADDRHQEPGRPAGATGDEGRQTQSEQNSSRDCRLQ